MHKSCILAATLSRLRAEAEARTVSSGNKGKRKKQAAKRSKDKEPPSLRAEWTDGRSGGYGAMITEGPAGRDGTGGHFWEDDVYCLGCGGLMR